MLRLTRSPPAKAVQAPSAMGRATPSRASVAAGLPRPPQSFATEAHDSPPRSHRRHGAAESQTQHLAGPQIELGERPAAQRREHPLGDLEVIDAKTAGVRVERERVGPAQRREIREAAVGADKALRAADDLGLNRE